MSSTHRSASVIAAFVVMTGTLAAVTSSGASADTTAQTLPFAQGWANTGLIAIDDNWDGVPGIVGYRGDGLTTATGVDPQTVLTEGTNVVDVNANQTNPNTFTTGGVAEFHLSDPVVALQGSGTADAPNLVLTLSTTGFVDIAVAYNLRDIDGSADNSLQPVAVQYRVGTTGNFTNVPAGFVADATTTPPATPPVTPVAVSLPAAADDQPVVQVRVITTDAAGSDEWVGVDDITVAGTPGGGGPASPVATCPATLVTESGVPASANVSATDADSAIASIEITSAPVAGIALTATGPGTARLDVAGTTAAGVSDVTIRFATDDDPAQETSCMIRVTVEAPPPLTTIARIQGAGGISPIVGQDVTVEAVVTSTFTRQDVPDGFFVQSAVGDGDPATSDGVFVFCRGACPVVAVGDLVRVRGEVTEFFGMTQVEATTRTNGRITTLSSGNPLPDATAVALPATGSTSAEATFETVEGMVVRFPATLAVSEYFELARYGQLILTVDERPHQFTHDHAPSPTGYKAFLASLATRRIILDDDNNDQNDAVSNEPDEPFPYPTDGLSVTNRMRGGDTIEGLTGVLHWSFAGQTGTDAWRIRPIPGVDYTFEPENEPTDEPDDVGGDLRIASFNVLNYFTTIDTTSNDVGPCGPSGMLDCRGADSDAELVRQRDKIVGAMKAMDADIIGLIELQNDAGASVADLVAALNLATSPGEYAFIDTGVIGTDAIKVAFIYRPSTATPVGAHKILTTAVDPDFIDTKNRPALIQTFQENATGERFTAAINHFKSKGSDCLDVGDPDLLDGQGNCSVTRTKAAQALADYLATDPTGSGDPDVIVMGDLNSYREERPITTLEAAGYNDLIEHFAGEDAYGYLFDGQLGYLDHALATDSLFGQVTGANEWHINADEPPLFDYNDDLRTTGEASFERESNALPIYAADQRRSSDHDPVIVGLDLSSLTVDHALIVAKPNGGGSLVMAADVDGTFTACPTLDLRVEGFAVFAGPTTRLGQSRTCLSLTSEGLVTFDLQSGAVRAVLTLPNTFRLTDDTVTFALTVNGAAHVVDRPGRRIGVIWATI